MATQQVVGRPYGLTQTRPCSGSGYVANGKPLDLTGR